MWKGLQRLACIAIIISLAGCYVNENGDYKPSNRARELNNEAVRALADGKFDEGIRAVNEALSYDPEFYVAYSNKAALLGRMNRNEEAATALETAISMRPSYVDAYVPLGIFREKAGKLDEAAANYKKAVDLYDAILAKTPDDVKAICSRAVALYLLHDGPAALTALKTALEKDPKNQDVLLLKQRIESGDRNIFLGEPSA